MRRWGLVVFAAAALAAPAAHAKAPLQVGAVVPEVLSRSLVPGTVAALRASGLNGAARVTLTWHRGETGLDPNLLADFRYGIDSLERAGADVYLTLYPDGSAQTPLTDADQATFAAWAAWLIRRLPEVGHVIVGNEPNLSRFWRPQFGPGGSDAAAPAYTRLLARTYDALKAASPGVEVVGGALSHRGSDVPGTGFDTHSPGEVPARHGQDVPRERADAADHGRLRVPPLPRAVGLPARVPAPELDDDHDRRLREARLRPPPRVRRNRAGRVDHPDRLRRVRRRVADPRERSPRCTPAPSLRSTQPVDEGTQARYYAQAMQLAACQPTVRTFLLFRLIDSPNLADWQSGVYYADGKTPKSSRAAVAAAARAARSRTTAGCGALLAPKPLVSFFPVTRPGPKIGIQPLLLRCNEDCAYTIRVTKLGRSHAGRRLPRPGDRQHDDASRGAARPADAGLLHDLDAGVGDRVPRERVVGRSARSGSGLDSRRHPDRFSFPCCLA